MKRVLYILTLVFITTSLFSCGITKDRLQNKEEAIGLSLKEKKEIVKQQIVKKQRTMIATP